MREAIKSVAATVAWLAVFTAIGTVRRAYLWRKRRG